MTPDADDLPVVGSSARSLGVRVPDDIRPDGAGQVLPRSGGVSVSPGSMWNLPAFRRPRGMKRGSTGPISDWVYSSSLRSLAGAGSLTVRLDPDRPEEHAFVEPAYAMPVEAYVMAIGATRPHWQRAWPS